MGQALLKWFIIMVHKSLLQVQLKYYTSYIPRAWGGGGVGGGGSEEPTRSCHNLISMTVM